MLPHPPSTSAAEHSIKIELEGVVAILAKNLYADPEVFLRELIQNAHDSIRKRAELGAARGDDASSGAIRVVPNRAERTLQIFDNGSGLTRQEIHDYLSTIGRSGTGELKAQLAARNRGGIVTLIGQFGIGLLSAFLVADRVEVHTRSAGGEALVWISDGGRGYSLDTGTRTDVGTTVTLALRNGNERFLDIDRLRRIVRTYADFLGLPVYLGREPLASNAIHAPWHLPPVSPEEEQRAAERYFEDRFKGEAFLDVFTVDQALGLPATLGTAGSGVRVRGVLGISEREAHEAGARGTVDIYVNRMLVSKGSREILPEWAAFVRGVIECDALTPNAARDDVMRDEVLATVVRVLGDRVVQRLAQLATTDRPRLIAVLRWHAMHVMGMCSDDGHEAFLRAVAELVPLRAPSEPVPLGEHFERCPALPDGRREIRYFAERAAGSQYEMLAQAKGLTLLDASEPYAERFLQRFAQVFPHRIRLRRIDIADDSEFFEPLTAEERLRFRTIETALELLLTDERACAVKASRFLPVSVPALLVETKKQKTRRSMAEFAQSRTLPSYLQGAVHRLLSEDETPPTLYVNAASPLIARLAARPTLRDDVGTAALLALHNNARMLLSRPLSSSEAGRLFDDANQLLSLLLERELPS